MTLISHLEGHHKECSISMWTDNSTWLNIHSWSYANLFVCVCALVYMCAKYLRWRTNLGVPPQESSCHFWTQGLSLAWNLPNKLGWLACGPRHLPVSISIVLRLQEWSTTQLFQNVDFRNVNQSLCLLNKRDLLKLFPAWSPVYPIPTPSLCQISEQGWKHSCQSTYSVGGNAEIISSHQSQGYTWFKSGTRGSICDVSSKGHAEQVVWSHLYLWENSMQQVLYEPFWGLTSGDGTSGSLMFTELVDIPFHLFSGHVFSRSERHLVVTHILSFLSFNWHTSRKFMVPGLSK